MQKNKRKIKKNISNPKKKDGRRLLILLQEPDFTPKLTVALPAGIDWSVSCPILIIISLSEMKKCVSKLKLFCSKTEDSAPAIDPVLLSVRQKPIEEFLGVHHPGGGNFQMTRSVLNLGEFNFQYFNI